MAQTDSFKAGQLKNKRVKDAHDTKWPALEAEMKKQSIDPKNYEVFLRVFKMEKSLEVWLRNKGEDTYKLFKTYAICASSGSLGPKRKEGDGQVPEGFYTIDLFNPASDYYLSMRVSYPNESDRILKKGKNAGGAIMVHGNCVTIGCIPITDEYIKELYILCLESKSPQTSIHIDIFPCKLTAGNVKTLEANYPKEKMDFWSTLKPVYDFFEKNKNRPKVKVDKAGKYYIAG
ncbi:MAG: L,D-transpeptidase family protein [Bacteroidetes bacterium]|nr:L,D-transpeptidase family protein [Bacteroidota bacterium]